MLGCAYLLVYCRYVHAGELKEEFLMCDSIESTTKAVNFVEKWIIPFNKIMYPGIMWVHFAQTVPLLCSVLSQAL